MEKYSCETDLIELKVELTWKIKDFTKIQQLYKIDELLESQQFQLTDSERTWNFAMYPKGLTDFSDRIAVSVEYDEILTLEEKCHCEISIIDRRGNKMYKTTWWEHDLCQYIGPESGEFSEQEKRNLLPDGVLTLFCVLTKMTVVVNPTETIESSSESFLNGDVVFQQKSNSNVVLKVGDRRITVPKALLSGQSPVFRSMFNRRRPKTSTNEITIVDIEFEVLRALVRYLYTAEISFGDVHFALKVLAAAYRYETDSLKYRCTEYLMNTVSVNTVFDVLIAAEVYDLDGLTDVCMSVIKCETTDHPHLTDWISKLKSHPELHEMIDAFLNPSSKDKRGSS